MPLPERHFLGWTESAAHSVAQWLYQRRDTLATNQSGVLDFTNTLVIVPGAGARRHVLAALRKLVPGAMIPPSMATPGKFMVNAFETPAGSVVAGPLERLTAICKALAKNNSLREQLLPNARATTLAALARPAKRLLDVIDRADDAHKSVAEISRLEILHNSPSMARSWENLAQLHAEMKRELQDMGALVNVRMLERSDVIDLADTARWKPKCGALVLAGLPDFARNVSFAAESLAKARFNGQPTQVHALVLAPASEAAKFDHLGVVIGGDNGFTSGPDIHDSMIEVAGDPADQAAATVARYCKLTGAVDTGDTCIVLADESLLPNMARAFAQHGRGVHSGGGITFAQTEVGQCLQRLEAATSSSAFPPSRAESLWTETLLVTTLATALARRALTQQFNRQFKILRDFWLIARRLPLSSFGRNSKQRTAPRIWRLRLKINSRIGSRACLPRPMSNGLWARVGINCKNGSVTNSLPIQTQSPRALAWSA